MSVSSGNEEDRDLIECGFLSALEDIRIGEPSFHPSIPVHYKMNQIDFVRSHLYNNTTALKTITINISDIFNVAALVELLAMSPNASTFTLQFHAGRSRCHESHLEVQEQAEQYWMVLLSVFYCNSKDKTVIIDTGRTKLTSPDWSFIKKPEYKRYQTVDNPGVIKRLIKKRFTWGMFYTAPDWNQLSISFDRVLIDLYASGPEI